MTPQRLPASLTAFEIALASLLRGCAPVLPRSLPLPQALHCVAAELPALGASPQHDVAAVDGWAMRAGDLVGASSYSPLPMAMAPPWVEVGDAIPPGCDCVVDADSIARSGPIPQALAEALPGQGVRRAGHDVAAGTVATALGAIVQTRDLLLARAAGLTSLPVRKPRLGVVNIADASVTAHLIAESARDAGAEVVTVGVAARDAASVARALKTVACDLMIAIGGSGVGRTDATVAALAAAGTVHAHGIAIQPGRTSAVGAVGATPVIVLPGAPDQAFAAWLMLALPAFDRLAARRPRRTVALPLARKIASTVGIAEVALLERRQDTWAPLAVGDLSLDAIARADAWLAVPADREGFAGGAAIDACMLRE